MVTVRSPTGRQGSGACRTTSGTNTGVADRAARVSGALTVRR